MSARRRGTAAGAAAREGRRAALRAARLTQRRRHARFAACRDRTPGPGLDGGEFASPANSLPFRLALPRHDTPGLDGAEPARAVTYLVDGLLRVAGRSPVLVTTRAPGRWFTL